MNHETPSVHRPRPVSAARPRSGPARMRAALAYATRPARGAVPAAGAMLTGLTALSLRCLPGVPGPDRLERIEVLVDAGRRLRGTADVTVRRAPAGTGLPRPRMVLSLPCAPLPRAVADAAATLADRADPAAVRALLVEAVRTGDCDPALVVAELDAAGLLRRDGVAGAVDELLARRRTSAEHRLYGMVRDFGLPDPLWNVDLRLPGGPYLGSVDAYWPRHAVALELDAVPADPRQAVRWPRVSGGRETLGRLGIAVISTTPAQLRASAARQASVVRTALLSADERAPRARVVVLPR